MGFLIIGYLTRREPMNPVGPDLVKCPDLAHRFAVEST